MLAFLCGRATLTSSIKRSCTTRGASEAAGFIFWKNIEAAKKAHGPAFQEAIQFIFGSKPEMQYFEAPIVIDNTAQQVLDNACLYRKLDSDVLVM